MTIDDKFNMKNYNIILIDKQQKYQRYVQVNSINMNILQMQNYFF